MSQAPGGSGGSSATDGFAIHAGLASDVDPLAPTTVGIVTWSLDKPSLTAAHLEFGLDTAYGMSAPVELSAPDYRTLLLGMKPLRTYHFRVVATDADGTYTSPDQTLVTGPKTELVNIDRYLVRNPEKHARGFLIASFWSGANATTPFILDADGEIVWWYERRPEESYGGIARARLSADSRNVWLTQDTLQGAPLRRVSVDGLERRTYGDIVASHDIAAVSGDLMAYLDYGEDDCNSIFEIGNDGVPREVFESTGIVDPFAGTLGCHGNALRYAQNSDVYLYSDWEQDVLVVNRDGTVAWQLSERVAGGNAGWGGAQHGVHLLDDSLLLFANKGAEGGGSAAVEFGLDGTLLRRFKSAGPTKNFGDVQRLPNGNTLVTYANAKVIQEVDEADNVVLDLGASDGFFGYVEYRESLYGPPDDVSQR